MLGRILFALARQPAVGGLVGLSFAHAADLIPVHRRLRTGRLLAFDHPKPHWPGHVLLVPRARIPSLAQLARPETAGYLADIVLAAQTLLHTVGLAEDEATLCANGGPRQDVGQVHFHWFVEAGQARPLMDITRMKPLHSDALVSVVHHPAPAWATHLVIVPQRATVLAPPGSPVAAAALAGMIGWLPRLCVEFDLLRRGYTLFITGYGAASRSGLSLHVTAGPAHAATASAAPASR